MTQLMDDVNLAPRRATREADKRRLPVLSVAKLLDAQRTLTAVERFAKQHDAGDVPAQSRYYRDLIPIEQPGRGQQFAFEVDLDACTGCKACVAACHTLNGLDQTEVWRTVGLLHGGTPESPVQQTVTTACHHCLDPACLRGCPVGAYEKDPVTGIVKHLDDQCFGCQYCTLMCPYDAPKYNAEKGVVRKCDMCSDRLAHGEAPACVQACPNQAIAVRIVDRESIIESADAQSFVSGAPAPDHTLPATRYKTRRALPSNLLPADFYRIRAGHSHPPLVVMLTFTQLAAGAFVLAFFTDLLTRASAVTALATSAFAAAMACAALLASLLHLGRPWLAFRAVLGIKTSWLSREALVFGLFAKLALLHLALLALDRLPAFAGRERLIAGAPAVQAAAALVGLGGVLCSVMVYVVTRREHWSGTQTGVRFFGTTLVLGASTVLAFRGLAGPADTLGDGVEALLCWIVLAGMGAKLGFELANLRHATDRSHSALKRVALVMLGQRGAATALRFALGLAGGALLPTLLAFDVIAASWVSATSAAMLAFLIGGELAERYLFFGAAPVSAMPGSLR